MWTGFGTAWITSVIRMDVMRRGVVIEMVVIGFSTQCHPNRMRARSVWRTGSDFYTTKNNEYFNDVAALIKWFLNSRTTFSNFLSNTTYLHTIVMSEPSFVILPVSGNKVSPGDPQTAESKLLAFVIVPIPGCLRSFSSRYSGPKCLTWKK